MGFLFDNGLAPALWEVSGIQKSLPCESTGYAELLHHSGGLLLFKKMCSEVRKAFDANGNDPSQEFPVHTDT